MITLVFATAALAEAPPPMGDGERRPFWGPGTRATVRVALHGPDGAGPAIQVSGATGAVYYGEPAAAEQAAGQATGVTHPYPVTQPFLAGSRAAVELAPDRLPALRLVEKISVSHDGQGDGPQWLLKSVTVWLESGQAVEFACNRWLAGEEVELAAGPTSDPPSAPSGQPSAGKPGERPGGPPMPAGFFQRANFNAASFV
jgi:hypothetical protein